MRIRKRGFDTKAFDCSSAHFLVGGIVRGDNTIARADREHGGVRELALDEADLSVERLIPALGQQIRVSVRAGSGVPLVLCNGIGASLEVLDPLVDQLDPDTTVVRFDVPGVGGSSDLMLPYNFPYLAAVLARLLSTLGLGREGVDVLGLSWGGALAQQFAFQNPRRCRRLILVAHQLLAASVWSSLFALPLIRQPTLIVAGTDDPIIPVVNARIMGRLLPHATMHLHTGGHVELVTNAAEFAPLIESFRNGECTSRGSTRSPAAHDPSKLSRRLAMGRSCVR